jgi:hypothetical protein
VRAPSVHPILDRLDHRGCLGCSSLCGLISPVRRRAVLPVLGHGLRRHAAQRRALRGRRRESGALGSTGAESRAQPDGRGLQTYSWPRLQRDAPLRPAPQSLWIDVPDAPPDAVLRVALHPYQTLMYRLTGEFGPPNRRGVLADAGPPMLPGLCTLGIVRAVPCLHLSPEHTPTPPCPEHAPAPPDPPGGARAAAALRGQRGRRLPRAEGGPPFGPPRARTSGPP